MLNHYIKHCNLNALHIHMKCLHISHGQFNILNVLSFFFKLWMPLLVHFSWMNFILLILFILLYMLEIS